MSRGVVTVCLLSAGLAGCATQRPDWARLGNTSSADDPPPVFYRNPHHQYFDRSRQRYYYYNPAEKTYFWENGEPRS